MPLGGVTMRFLFILSVFALFFGQSGDAFAEPHAVGPEKCQKCHTGSYKVWEGTKHFLSFKTVHKNKKARKIVKAIGERRICLLYTSPSPRDGLLSRMPSSA